jgi:hypothetical protein
MPVFLEKSVALVAICCGLLRLKKCVFSAIDKGSCAVAISAVIFSSGKDKQKDKQG